MTLRFRRKLTDVEAMRHDGSEESAIRLSNWINLHGAQASIIDKNVHDEAAGFEKHLFYIRFHGETPRSIVSPGSWIIKLDSGIFYTLTHSEFELVYEPIESDISDETDSVTIPKEVENGKGSTYA